MQHAGRVQQGLSYNSGFDDYRGSTCQNVCSFLCNTFYLSAC